MNCTNIILMPISEKHNPLELYCDRKKIFIDDYEINQIQEEVYDISEMPGSANYKHELVFYTSLLNLQRLLYDVYLETELRPFYKHYEDLKKSRKNKKKIILMALKEYKNHGINISFKELNKVKHKKPNNNPFFFENKQVSITNRDTKKYNISIYFKEGCFDNSRPFKVKLNTN